MKGDGTARAIAGRMPEWFREWLAGWDYENCPERSDWEEAVGVYPDRRTRVEIERILGL